MRMFLTYAEYMEQFLYYLDPDTKKITKLEKLQLKLIQNLIGSPKSHFGVGKLNHSKGKK